jgi:poly(3-hydroxybutyrate) depolymerase
LLFGDLYARPWAALDPWCAWTGLARSQRDGCETLGRVAGVGWEVAARTAAACVPPRLSFRELLAERRRDGGAVVVERVVEETPFYVLRAFACRGWSPRARVILLAPCSGYAPAVLHELVAALLPQCEVTVTDWTDGRLIPAAAGGFGLVDQVEAAAALLRRLGPEAHLVAVSQAAPAALAAVALLATEQPEAAPRSLVLLGGPIDARRNPSFLDRQLGGRSLAWVENHLTAVVPPFYPGMGRRVYPGALHLAFYSTLNPRLFLGAQLGLFWEALGGRANGYARFHEELYAVTDVPAEVFLDTIRVLYRDHDLPRGRMRVRGTRIEPAAITRTALMTIEGGRDELVSPGQTQAAHDLCPNVPAANRAHHVQRGAAHYALFKGPLFWGRIAPRLRTFILSHSG